jgi:hypothetical protein
MKNPWRKQRDGQTFRILPERIVQVELGFEVLLSLAERLLLGGGR